MLKRTIAAAALTLGLSAGAAHADPCTAIPDRGPMPSYLHKGATFSGKVVHIGDGDSLCVAVGPSPDQWVEVRLQNFYAPEIHDPGGAKAKAQLRDLTFGRMATCVASHRSYDRIVAACRIGGRDIGDLMRGAGVAEGGRGWR